MTAKFAFYGRVSTEDQQDPAASRDWQLSRSRALIEPAGGVVVAEFFDIGQSRSLPWKRRPEAMRLLEALKRNDRTFDAIVVGEPARAFSGHQYALTFPVFVHYGVELWVPEVGGRVDPDSEAHDMMMSLFGGMSKAERSRIKVRVRSAMASQAATEGRFLGGRPPYGYQLADAGPHPNPSKAAIGQHLHRLEPDPISAPIVVRIFDEYVAGAGIGAIAENLNRDRIPSPSGHDPARNRHRALANGAWGKSAVRAILTNPRYTGRSVWNRQRRDEVLLDVDDVAAGYKGKMSWNDRTDWIWSAEITHEPLVSPEAFAAASAQRSVGKHRQATVKPRRQRTYCLSSLVHCGDCGRRMSGAWSHEQAYYRCTFPTEYAGTAQKHERGVYLREADITAALDGWLLSVFDPKNLDGAVAALAAAQAPDEANAARSEAARRKLADCDSRLASYRAPREKGADPALVAEWTREVQAERLAAERELAATTSTSEPLSEAEIRALVGSQRKVLRALSGATAEQRAAIYGHVMGLRITYNAERHSISIESRPACTGCVSVDAESRTQEGDISEKRLVATNKCRCTQVRVGEGT